MKLKMLTLALISSASIAACTPNPAGFEYAINPNINQQKFGEAKQDFEPEQEFEYVAIEQYGSKAFKVISVCHNEYSRMLNGIDMSSTYGSSVLTEYSMNVENCTNQTLAMYYTPIPENQRQKIPRENVGLELNESEVKEFDKTILPAIANEFEGTSYRDDPRFQKNLAKCAGDNMTIENDQDFVEAVDICALKGM